MPRCLTCGIAVCSRWVQSLEGVFYSRNGHCVTTWIFEGGSFRHQNVPAPAGTGDAESGSDASDSASPCGGGPSLEMGSFRIDKTANIEVVTFTYAYSSANLGSTRCSTRSMRLVRDCQRKVIFEWLSQGPNCRVFPRTVLYQSQDPQDTIHDGGGSSAERSGVGAQALIGAKVWRG